VVDLGRVLGVLEAIDGDCGYVGGLLVVKDLA
jgi:hypothetical protein